MLFPSFHRDVPRCVSGWRLLELIEWQHVLDVSGVLLFVFFRTSMMRFFCDEISYDVLLGLIKLRFYIRFLACLSSHVSSRVIFSALPTAILALFAHPFVTANRMC